MDKKKIIEKAKREIAQEQKNVIKYKRDADANLKKARERRAEK